MACTKHPDYTGELPPTVDCASCRKAYAIVHKTDCIHEIAQALGKSQRAVSGYLAGVDRGVRSGPRPSVVPSEQAPQKKPDPGLSRLQDLISGLSPDEQKLLEASIRGHSRQLKVFDHSFSTNHIKFGYYSDPHVGVIQFKEALWMQMLARFKEEGIEIVYCPGDNVEGMSGRPGHVFQLSHVGAEQQLTYASELFAAAPAGMHFFIIDGNHDQWFKQKADIGVVVGKQLQNRNTNVTFLGEWEADVRLAKGVLMKLFHANDGTAYADSYKLQKLIESFTGGQKPSLVLSGHYHKQVAIFRRNVFGFECGTLCGQTEFMRGKKLPAHMGFGIIELWVASRGGIERLRHEFFPFYD